MSEAALRPYGQRGNYPLPPLQKDADGKPLCRWCGGPLPRLRRSWCSKTCVDEYLARADWNRIRANILKRDVACRICGGCRAKRVVSQRPRPLLLVRSAYALVWGDHSLVRFGWEVDHIVAVKDGGTDDPANLRLLCLPCHHEITAAQHQRWARERRGQIELLESV